MIVVAGLMSWWSSVPLLQSASNLLGLIACLAAVLAAVAGIASNFTAQRAGELLQAKNEDLQRQTTERVATLDRATSVAQVEIAHAKVRVSDAQQKAAEANERAARLDVVAADLKSRLSMTTDAASGRWLTDRQRAIFLKELRGHRLTVEICWPRDDPETRNFVTSIQIALHDAGQEVVLSEGGCNSVSTSSDAHAGVEMLAPSMEEMERSPVYRALVRSKLWRGFEKATAERIARGPVLNVQRRSPPLPQSFDASGQQGAHSPKLKPRT